MSPLFSIIIPVYNVAPYLGECLDSVLAQTISNWEAICVDDGSTDGCGIVLDEYAAKDGRFRVIHQANGGVSAARNAALDMARGEWLSFLDADDWIEDSYLKDLHEAALSRDCDIALSSVKKVSPNGDTEWVGPISDCEKAPEDLYVTYNALCAWAWGKLYKRKAWDGLRFPTGIAYSEDRYILHEVLYKYGAVPILGKTIYNHRMRAEGALGGRWNASRLQQRLALERQLLYFREHGYPLAELFTAGLYFKGIGRQLVQFKREAPNNPLLQTVREELASLQKTYWDRFVDAQRKYRWNEFPSLGEIKNLLEDAVSSHRVPKTKRVWNLLRFDGLATMFKKVMEWVAFMLNSTGRNSGRRES